jgi:stage III sporulation protein AA
MLDLGFLGPEARAEAERMGDSLSEVRLRANRPVELVSMGGRDVLIGRLDARAFRETVQFLMGYSLYAREDELANGFFTLPDGSRAGVCGMVSSVDGRLKSVTDIGSIAIRVAREIVGCAQGILPQVETSEGTLIVSPPGLGKTTLLRDIARLLSERGSRVCVIDERGEIAACKDGVPTLDVGPRTDVFSMCLKRAGLMTAIRALSPDVVVTDELGAPGDGAAVLEAARCGVRVIASAHGASLDPEFLMPGVARIIREGAFSLGVLLGPRPGAVKRVKRWEACKSAAGARRFEQSEEIPESPARLFAQEAGR